MKKLLIAAAVSLAALSSAPAMADSFGVRIVNDGISMRFGIGTPPPAPMEFVPPAAPGAVWTPGYWAWDGYRYIWVQGRWVAAAPPVAVYPLATPRWGWGFAPQHRRDERWEERREHRPHGGWRDR